MHETDCLMGIDGKCQVGLGNCSNISPFFCPLMQRMYNGGLMPCNILRLGYASPNPLEKQQGESEGGKDVIVVFLCSVTDAIGFVKSSQQRSLE
jgi:hypothetical protein